ncbi:MAG: GNAT family N-acetyltransferase [Promethearchaeota archaeon]
MAGEVAIERAGSGARYEVEEVENPTEVSALVYLGTNLPLLPAFQRYVRRNVERFGARSLVLHAPRSSSPTPLPGTKDWFVDRGDDACGHALVYDDGGDTLFFGFFGTTDHDPGKIDALVDAVTSHAREGGYARIRGPVNVPTMLYGWGFSVPGSTRSPFVGCPSNPPVYQERFLSRGFRVLYEELRFKCPLLRFDPYSGKGPVAPYDFSDYEYFNPGPAEMGEVKDALVDLHVEYMPPSAAITPNAAGNADDVVDFVREFGDPWMIYAVRHRPTGEIVAGGYGLPNPFSAGPDGRPESISMHDWVVHPEYRRAGLTMLMYGATTAQLRESWGLWPVGADNEASIAGAKKMGGVLDRVHLILQAEL